MKALFTYWSLDATSIVLLLIITAFMITGRCFSNKKTTALIIIILAICLSSPLRLLSTQYLFSAHMVVHVILLLCIGPLLISSISPGVKQLPMLFKFLKRQPVVGWIACVGVMWFWHIPALFNSAMSSMHQKSFDFPGLFEAISLILAGILFSAPIIHPNKEYRIDALPGVVYLFTACIGCSLLGLLITFAPAGTYRHFLSMNDGYGLNKIILNNWHITQSTDQQAAGLIMWVPCCLIYVTGAMNLLVHWFKQKEEIIAFTK
ncbi:MAG: cytochrome c oxidase assembly protein [Flavisolibacter sp.]